MHKKTLKNLAKFIVPNLFFLTLMGCESEPYQYSSDLENWTQQPIEKAIDLKVGMSQQEVIEILGEPIVREFQGRESVMQWCKTGGGNNTPYDRFLIVWFINERLVGTKNYSNKDEQQYGDCKTLYREVDWTPQADRIIEVRDRKVAY